MIAGPEENRIVRTWPAAQTGESYYQTADGRVWKTAFRMETLTGVSYGSIEGDRMISPPRSSAVPFYPRGQDFARPKPLPEPDSMVVPPSPERPPKRLLRPPASFVGAGPMHRRWR